MSKHPKEMSFVAFQREFPDDDACRKYMFEKRWSDGFRCPVCGTSKYYEIASRQLYQCSNPACRHQASATAGTVMHRSKVPLHIWFWAIFLVVHDKRGMSALALQRQLGMTYKTSWLLLHKIREGMASREESWLVDGTVEMDEAFFGGSTTGKKRGRGTEKATVMVSLSLLDGNKPTFVKMQLISDMTSKSVEETANKTIKKGSCIISDGYHSYRCLAEKGYCHRPKKFNPTDEPEHLKWMHTIIANAKAFIQGTYHGLDQKHLQAYLHEFCYRFNIRNRHGKKFKHLLYTCLMGKPITYREILGS